MKTLLTLACFLMVCSFSFGQSIDFHSFYSNHPLLTPGILESVSWNNTRMKHLSNQQESCSGMPSAYGILGLHDNGASYFRENGKRVEELSGISVSQQKASPQQQLEAYAIAYELLMSQEIQSGGSTSDGNSIRSVLNQLSEIPDTGIVNLFALDLQTSEVLRCISSVSFASAHDFTPTSLDFPSIYGADNYSVLSAKKILITEHAIEDKHGHSYQAQLQNNIEKSIEYGPAIWNPTPSCNFSSRNGVAVEAITIHTIQGSYSGAISWSQNCSSNVSYHYVVRSSDGQVTQMVSEADKAWHVGSENPYTIGYEHEGYVDDPTWYTEAMYQSSADISRDVVSSGYGIPPLRTFYGEATIDGNVLGNCTKIKGHQHYPNQTHTDPGINWDWEKYYRLINNTPTITTITATTGTLTDSGGSNGNYQNDERDLWLIAPTDAASVSLDFTTFNIEADYDNLFIYDGNNLDAPLIGSYTGTTSPGQIQSSSGSLLIEFRSDCGTTAEGWEVSYSSTVTDIVAPTTSITPSADWLTDDLTAQFIDTDNESGIQERFYQPLQKSMNDNYWSIDESTGFLSEEFEEITGDFTDVTGTFSINNGVLSFSDNTQENSNTYTLLNQENTHTYLFEWNQTITSAGPNQRAGLHFFCDDPTLPNRGNSYFVYFRESWNLAQIYRVTNDVYQLEEDIPFTTNQNETYLYRVTYSPTTGWIKVYINDQFIGQWQDPSPLQAGNSVSFRSGGCAVNYDNLRVYQSRADQEIIEIGNNETIDIQSENATPSMLLRSVVVDSSENWSSLVDESFLVDYSIPELNYLNDGLANDIDEFHTPEISANWSASDIHSGIMSYDIAIGTSSGSDDILAWNSIGGTTTHTHVLSNPIPNQLYFISIRAYNGAGLVSEHSSNGQLYVPLVGTDESTPLDHIHIWPNPAQSTLHISGATEETSVLLINSIGKVCAQYTMNEAIQIDASALANGTYFIQLSNEKHTSMQRIIISH